MGDVSFAADERASWRLRLPLVREAVLCTGVAAAVASLLVWLGPPGGDLAAHEYQRSVYLGHGFTLWDNFWYAGRYAFVNYSVLYYPLAALLGIGLLSVLSVALGAGAFARLLEREWGRTALLAGRSFALVWPGVILAGELPLALGVALALPCLLALQAGRRWAGAVLILLVLAASPVAFVLLAVVLAGSAVGRRPHLRLRAAAVPAAAVALAAAAELLVLHLFPVGDLGFPAVEAIQAAVFCVVLLGLTWRLERARGLRGFLAVYLVAVIATYVIPSGLGHDIARVRLLAIPITLLVVALRRWRVERLPAREQLGEQRVRPLGEPARLGSSGRLSARTPADGLPRRGGGHGRPLAGAVPRPRGHPDRARLVPPGRPAGGRPPLPAVHAGAVRCLAAASRRRLCRPHQLTAGSQLATRGAHRPERGRRAQTGLRRPGDLDLRRPAPTADRHRARPAEAARAP
jgi:hypothetical protein